MSNRPLFFYLFIDVLPKGNLVKNIRFADDIVLVVLVQNDNNFGKIPKLG